MDNVRSAGSTQPEEHRTTPETVEEFADRIHGVRRRIAAAAERSGRSGDDVRLLPVSKTVPQDRIRLAVAAGCTALAENKVQEALRKHHEMSDLDIEWAIVGHLQRNKTRDVAEFATEFHALDSLRLAEALDRRLQAAGRGIDVYIQVNTSGEDSKYGLAPDDVGALLTELPHYSSLRVKGFMTLALFTADTDRVRECFRLLKSVRDRARDTDRAVIGPGELSMGMSGDFEAAIEEGADVVRVGQAIFGPRPTPDSHYWPGVG